MKVKELIEKLNHMPPDLDVCMLDAGYDQAGVGSVNLINSGECCGEPIKQVVIDIER